MDLRIRDFPNEVQRQIKSKAAALGISLRDYVIEALKEKPYDRLEGTVVKSDAGGANRGMAHVDAGAEVGRAGDRTAMPVLAKAKGKKKLVHPVQPVRDELGDGRRVEPQPEGAGPGAGEGAAEGQCRACGSTRLTLEGDRYTCACGRKWHPQQLVPVVKSTFEK